MLPRAATSIVLAGSALLLAWGVRPAVSAPPAVVPPPPLINALDQAAPVQNEVDREVGRLQERLTVHVAYPQPLRDPFNFGRRPEAPARVPPPAAPLVVTAPPPALPRLIAIVANPSPDGVVRKVALSDGDDVQFVGSGEAAGAFTVRAIDDASVVLVDRASGVSYSLALY